MSDMNIDSLQIEIASSSTKAEESLDKLTASLQRLKTGLEGLDVKSTGLASLASSFRRLGNVTKNYNPSSLNQILESIKSIGSASSNFSSISTFVKSINSIIRSADKIKSTSEVFPTLSSQMREFFESMSNMDISDNTVRMAEALAKISRHGEKAGASIDTVNKAASRGAPLMRSLSKGADTLLLSLKNISGGALKGLKDLTLQISGLSRSSPSVSSLTFNLKNLLATVIGFRGITGLFNWAKESVRAGAELTEIDHIVESVFGKDMVGYVEEWASNAIESFGIAGTAAKKYAGTMSAMFQASNVDVSSSNKMAMDLVKLAGDLSAFYNIDTETAYNKLKSGMAGMVRPLRKQNCAYVQKCA